MEQLNFLENKTPTEFRLKSCAFTGHRFLGRDFSERELKKEIEKMIIRGVTDFYNGAAMGFDLIAAEIVLKFKKKYPQIRLIVCIPCWNQERGYSEEDKKRYARIVRLADESVQIAEKYYDGCMLARDRYMVYRADAMIAYCRRNSGGTAYTVNQFIKRYGKTNLVCL